MNFESIVNMAKGSKKEEIVKKPEKSQEELRGALESKLESSKPVLQEGIKEYEQALKDDTFEDQDGEAEGAGEKRKEAMQAKLSSMFDRAEKMRKQLDSGEILEQIPEADTILLEPFLRETFGKWYSGDQKKIDIPQRPSLVDPQSLDFSSLKSDDDPSKFGEYTLNPECIGIDFETAKIKVLDIQKEIKTNKLTDIASIGKYIIDTYSKDYIIPDLSFWQWMIEKGANAPTELLDGNYHYCFGSILRGSGGGASVPFAFWDGSGFRRDAFRLGDGWYSRSRVALLER
ncbi:MAG: hypothetical protein WCK10_01025 [Candidatus Staskawiczbacteria bacterium]